MSGNEFYKKNKLREGDLIEFVFEGNKIKGIILPVNGNESNLKIKLASGYNAGFEIKKITNLNKLPDTKKENKTKSNLVTETNPNLVTETNPNLPRIAFLHTGGTIASRINYLEGGVSASIGIEDLVRMIPEITKLAKLELVSVTNIMSEDLQKEHLQKIASVVSEQIKKGVKGVIIGHGTDMLGYSASALAFALEGCPIPVVFVGAQKSSDRGSSDASMNLVCALTFAAKTNYKGVVVCMHNSISDEACAIINSTKVRKMHTTRRDAFKPINDSPIALVNYKTREVEWVKKKSEWSEGREKEFELKNNFEEKVGLIKVHPFSTKEELDYYKKENYKGLIIEGTGLGHTPIRENESYLKKISELVESGCVVGVTSQCINGRVNNSVYSNLRKLNQIGVIHCEDMISETALIKLAWLLGNYSKKEVKELLTKNLRGEITLYSRVDNYFCESEEEPKNQK